MKKSTWSRVIAASLLVAGALVPGDRIEYRVEITPTIGGQEDAVLRVLSTAKIYPLDQIGFSAQNLERMRAAIQKPYGIILCVGPTGSGKTTTLASMLDVMAAHLDLSTRYLPSILDAAILQAMRVERPAGQPLSSQRTR